MREPSFVKSLFLGVIEEGMIFPWLEPAATEVTKLHSLLDAVRRFFEQHVDSAAIDRKRRIDPETLAGLKQLGCFGLRTPEADGGIGLTNTGAARIMQEIAGLDASIAMTLGAHQSIGMKGLLLFGTDAQKKRYLARLARGQLVAAFALAETSGGSDAAAIHAKARMQPDGTYVLDGSKIWTTNGGLADVFTVFARTSSTEDGAKPEITAFFVERGPGVTSATNDETLGVRGASVTTVDFDHVAVPAENVIGPPGQGLHVAMQVLDSGRLDLASGCVGLCRRVIKMAVERCRERRAFGRPIGEFGLVKDKIATMISETWALECVTYLTTGRVDAGADDFSVESAICKVFGSETCWRVVNESLQVAAGTGYMAADPYERLLRDARVNLVFEGTSEVLRGFIAMSGMQGPARRRGDVARAIAEPFSQFGLLREFAIRKARGAFGPGRMTRHHPLLDREAAIFETYVHELSRGLDAVLRKHGRDIAEMQYTQKRTADVAIDLYAIAASIARATRVAERRGEEGARREIDLTRIFVAAAEQRLRQTVAAIDKNDDELRKAVATRAYADGAYPFDIT